MAAAALLGAAAVMSVSAQEDISVGIDADIAGNSATAVGQTDSCIAVEEGSAFSVDIFALNIPARTDVAGGSGGTAGFSYNLLFDPAIVDITSVDNEFMLAAGGDFFPFEVIDADAMSGVEPDPLPATTGNLRVDFGDLSTDFEDGNGVLSRLELRAKGPGETVMRLVDIIDERASPSLLAGAPNQVAYPVATVYHALVVVGGECGDMVPAPYLPPDGGGPGTIGDLPDDHADRSHASRRHANRRHANRRHVNRRHANRRRPDRTDAASDRRSASRQHGNGGRRH